MNNNAGEKFYLMQTFAKVRNLVKISKILKNLENLKKLRMALQSSLSLVNAQSVLVIVSGCDSGPGEPGPLGVFEL